jgi:NTP pyrophosphatase (non-canonical NTP hydrolase)/predicted kinase
MSGSENTVLVTVRGNSASGKSSVASGIRDRYGRGLAIVGQDQLRRVILRVRDQPGNASVELISLVARYALDRGFHTVIEGILYADRYSDMLAALRRDHRGVTRCYYLDVPLEETLRRHAGKPQAAEYGRAEMSGWYRDKDLLPGGVEQVITADWALDTAVDHIMRDTGLAAPASAPRAGIAPLTGLAGPVAGEASAPAGSDDGARAARKVEQAAAGSWWEHIARLHAYHGDVPPEVQLLKLTEEVGEAAEALIGMHGWNRRKGTHATPADVLDELADVIITAAVAMSGIAGDEAAAAEHFARKLATVLSRAGLGAAESRATAR